MYKKLNHRYIIRKRLFMAFLFLLSGIFSDLGFDFGSPFYWYVVVLVLILTGCTVFLLNVLYFMRLMDELQGRRKMRSSRVLESHSDVIIVVYFFSSLFFSQANPRLWPVDWPLIFVVITTLTMIIGILRYFTKKRFYFITNFISSRFLLTALYLCYYEAAEVDHIIKN